MVKVLLTCGGMERLRASSLDRDIGFRGIGRYPGIVGGHLDWGGHLREGSRGAEILPHLGWSSDNGRNGIKQTDGKTSYWIRLLASCGVSVRRVWPRRGTSPHRMNTVLDMAGMLRLEL